MWPTSDADVGTWWEDGSRCGGWTRNRTDFVRSGQVRVVFWQRPPELAMDVKEGEVAEATAEGT
jgi:hypothetical protein